ncbi:RimK family protein [Aliifodinibius sp. S!AR15-10]|uniref:RimK family protein n=1 Tax=Aliifodinibius sp. S!AR15-10 TaxID=2950437 RepID=UPI0028608FD1|nr:RimK family protein [Aliifodinibius sp. S!AR15-10]MDR8391662.1 RimK family protein [Aliifodinibius sp. S!AR15-10]
MKYLFVVNNPRNWPLQIPEGEIVSAKLYLSDSRYSNLKNVRLFNLCRSYRYQSIGYYVSLLAMARGHKPMPNVLTIQDLKSSSMVRYVSDELDAMIQKNLKPIQSSRFTLSIYFGRNLAKRYDKLSQQLFMQFQAPLLRAHFVKSEKWNLQSIGPIAASDIPEDHRPFVVEKAREYFNRRHSYFAKKGNSSRFDLAILANPEEQFPPSDERALQKFTKAAESVGFYVERITWKDYGRLAEFDGLFIRETTNVNHHTYRFSRKAAAEGLVVIDDPESILRCTNKVYLAELLERNKIAAPKTMIVSEENAERIQQEIGMPCILKQPDSSFSQGVVKADTAEELQEALRKLFSTSDLLIAQEFIPTEFDWRVGILNGKPLYVCKYFMARKHWQIYEQAKSGRTYAGRAETLKLEDAPDPVVTTALKAANLIGDGFYGVDLKQVNGKVYVIEVNDNPSIDAGIEDEILKDELYTCIMREILGRIEKKKGVSTQVSTAKSDK